MSTMTRQDAKKIRNDIREEYDFGERFWLTLERFGRDDWGFELLVGTDQLQIADSREWASIIRMRDPDQMRRVIDCLRIPKK